MRDVYVRGIALTSDTLLDHIHGEITYKTRTYFIVDGEWYQIHPDFIQELNKECTEILKQVWVTPDNIECCDILQHDDTAVHLIHVKKGFDNSIRELASQVLISAKRIREDIKTGYNYIDQVEQQARSGLKSGNPEVKKLAAQSFPAGGLKQLFINRKDINICFCLAFVDTAGGTRKLRDDIDSFHSNIAKYSLVELRREIMSMGFSFKVIQLYKQ